jgi:hypothetical protein
VRGPEKARKRGGIEQPSNIGESWQTAPECWAMERAVLWSGKDEKKSGAAGNAGYEGTSRDIRSGE